MATDTVSFPALQGRTYINLVTYRKNGTPVQTPVWFAEDGGVVYVFTNGETGKVKRVRNNPQVVVAPADARGTPLGIASPGHARIVTGVEAKRADAALARKYGLLKWLFTLVARVRGQTAVYLAVRPTAL